MTGEDFHAQVTDPTILDGRGLKELTARYPFFRTPHLLLAKHLRDTGHIDQRRQLHLAAILASDRSLLLDLMEGRVSNRKHEIGKEKYESGKEKSGVGEIEAGAEEVVTVQPEQEEQETAEVQAAEEVTVPVESETQAEVTLTVPEARETAPLDFDLIPEPVLYRIDDALLAEEQEPAPAKEPEPDSLPFDQWLARLSDTYSDSPESHHSTPINHQSSITNHQSLAPRPSLKDNIALIEDFLAAQPKDGKPKRAEFYKASKAAERSNTMDLTGISETLANIYAQQGQIELAAKAFDALALKYPDKSSYFAARKTEALQKSSDQ